MSEKIEFEKEKIIILLYNGSQWEDKTFSIYSIYKAFYFNRFNGYNVYFNNNSNKYFYHRINTKFLNFEENIDIRKMDVYIDGRIINAIKVDKFSEGHYRVYTNNNTFTTKNLKLKPAKYNDLYEYYIRLASYAGTITEEGQPLYYLSRSYNKLNKTRDTALYDFFNREFKKIEDSDITILPFAFNQSQYFAIDKALRNSISVIEGPPGTGKTQTILNLIMNFILRGKSVAVISNNNTAIENVGEKLDEEGFNFIYARLGSRTNTNKFFEASDNKDLEDFLLKYEEKLPSYYKSDIKDLTKRIQRILQIELDVAKLKEELREVKIEKKNHDLLENLNIPFKKNLDSKDFLELYKYLTLKRKLGFFSKLYIKLKYKIRIKDYKLSAIIDYIENIFLSKRIEEISNKIDQFELEIKEKDSINKQIISLSNKVISNHLRKHYSFNKFSNFTEENYKADFKSFVKRYLVILSTTQSLINNVPGGFCFDYLIIDEASQCDLLSSVLPLSITKNLVVVGDSKQLKQIDETNLYDQAKKLKIELDIEDSYCYENNSLLNSIKNSIPKVPTTLLREHYRCSPDIISFCNKMFYNNKLIIMTENEGNHISIIKTVPGNHARKNPKGSGFYNQREIDEIVKLINNSKDNDVGVITPFRYHANLIKEEVSNIEVDTIHKFQGRQKDEIILSFVVNSLEKNPEYIENRLYDFLTNDQLLNVAISRAKSKVTLIISDGIYNSKNNSISDFIKHSEYIYGSKVVSKSKITSVFDYLYSNINNELRESFKKKPKLYLSELLMSEIINKVLSDYSYINYSMHVRLSKIVQAGSNFLKEEIEYINHPWTHVDFLFYNNVSKQVLFVIEVDGIRYHEQNQKQIERDSIKNRVLIENGIDIYRFKTNESNEEERLREILKKYIY